MCFCLSCALSHSSCEIIGSWLLCTTIQSFLSLAPRLWFLYEIVVSCNCAKCPRYIMLFTIYVDIEKAAHFVRLFLVGVARFELAALRSRTVRATKLRYTPIMVFNYVVSFQIRNVLLCLVARLALTEGFADVSLFGVLPVSRCVAPSLPLPYATQTALHPDNGIQLCCFVPNQERILLFGSASRAHRRFCPRALRAANAQLY